VLNVGLKLSIYQLNFSCRGVGREAAEARSLQSFQSESKGSFILQLFVAQTKYFLLVGLVRVFGSQTQIDKTHSISCTAIK
jgi:hypothetical protein